MVGWSKALLLPGLLLLHSHTVRSADAAAAEWPINALAHESRAIAQEEASAANTQAVLEAMGSGNIGLGYAEHREMQDEQKAEMQEMSVAHVLATRVGGLAQETLESVAMASAAAAKKETAIADSAEKGGGKGAGLERFLDGPRAAAKKRAVVAKAARRVAAQELRKEMQATHRVAELKVRNRNPPPPHTHRRPTPH
jgi:hypothetical protein